MRTRLLSFSNCVTIAVILATALVCTPECCNAQSSNAQTPATQPEDDWHFRYELFQMLLEQNGVRPGASVRDVMSNPSDSVVVLLGSMSLLSPRYLESFCERGGAVLMATDQRHSAGRICEFSDGPVTARYSRDRYQNFPDCLTITNIESEHPLMKGVKSLVVNRAGWLAPPRWFIPDWQIAARLPSKTSPESSSEKPVLATVGLPQVNTGQLIIASDPSLFTNGMLWHGDNAILAINVSKALSVGNKSRLLFVVDGVSLGSFQDSPMVNSLPNPPLPDNLPQPGLETFIYVINTALKEVEDRNVLNLGTADRASKIRPPFYRRSLLFSIGIAALLFVIWRLAGSGSTTHSPMPTRQMKSAHDLSAGRKVKAAEFGLSASMLAREFCRDVTGASDPGDWRRLLGENVPTGSSSLQFNHVPNEAALRKQIGTVLDLASNTRTVHISRKRFESIGHMILNLRHLHQTNCLQIDAGASLANT